MYVNNFIMVKFSFFTNFNLDIFLKITNAHVIQTSVHTRISNGQWTHAIIREIFMNINSGSIARKVFLYHANHSAVTNAILTVAWSDGKLASGK
jgi:phenolic acid decarboxylase